MKAVLNPYQPYVENQVATADQKQLIIMLYDGAIKFLNIAVDKMHFSTYDIVNNNIIKAQDIITELMLSLDMEKGGDIAQNLLNIYAFMKKELIEANIKKDKTAVAKVAELLANLKEGWEQIDTSKLQEKSNAIHPSSPEYRGIAAQA